MADLTKFQILKTKIKKILKLLFFVEGPPSLYWNRGTNYGVIQRGYFRWKSLSSARKVFICTYGLIWSILVSTYVYKVHTENNETESENAVLRCPIQKIEKEKTPITHNSVYSEKSRACVEFDENVRFPLPLEGVDPLPLEGMEYPQIEHRPYHEDDELHHQMAIILLKLYVSTHFDE